MKNSEIACDLLTIANDDLNNAKDNILEPIRRKIRLACFCAQQACEKAFKAFLIINNIEPERTHNLTVLCEKCIKIDSSFNHSCCQ
jgi:HEPN domain-containing protein